MPLHHEKQSDGSWKTYTDEEWAARHPTGWLGPTWVKWGLYGVIVGAVFGLCVVEMLPKSLQNSTAFGAFAFTSFFAIGAGISVAIHGRNSQG